MSEHAANEEARTATGAQARFARLCARNPWRVVLIWFVSTVVLVGLVIGFHGTLVNEFKLPGSDTQRAADLLEAKFPRQNGSSLTFVLQAPKGQRIDSAEHKAAVAKIIAL